MAKKDRTNQTSRSGEKPGNLERIGIGSSGGDGKGMKATDLLKRDHDRVKKLFAEYEDVEGSTKRQKEIVDEISRELEIHSQLEEKIFYQSFWRSRDEKPKEIVRESFEEHKIVKTLLSELARMKPSDEQYDAKVTVLKESVQHHVQEEEGDLFPAAEKELSDEQLEQLGAEMEDLKEEIQQTFERSTRSRGRRARTTRQRRAET